MEYDERVQAKLKWIPEDFIVEEIGPNWACRVSREFLPNQKPVLNGLSEERKDYLWCEMEKKNIDHFSAIKDVAKSLGKSLKDIGYAGSKDRVAWTSQRVSIFKPDLERLRNFSHKNIILKNFKWEKRKIKMGYLNGNHFLISVRDIDKKDAIFVCQKIRSCIFFPNYFGFQRFGSVRENNFKIGKLILKRDFEGAIWAILSEKSESEKDEVIEAREKIFKERDFGKALDYFPKFLVLERSILKYLSKNPFDYLGAIKSCERKSILMYVHSVQSYLFNEVLRRAMEEGIDFRKKGQENCLLFGYKSKFSAGRLGEIEREVLKENDISLEDFDLREIPFLRLKGSFRKAIIRVENLKVSVEEDEIFSPSKKIVLDFSLDSGAYATSFLDNFFVFKNSNS